MQRRRLFHPKANLPLWNAHVPGLVCSDALNELEYG